MSQEEGLPSQHVSTEPGQLQSIDRRKRELHVGRRYGRCTSWAASAGLCTVAVGATGRAGIPGAVGAATTCAASAAFTWYGKTSGVVDYP